MAHQFDIIPEDGAIRALVQILGIPKPNQSEGISVVLNKIEKQFSNRFAVGLIDDDKRKPALFDNYALLKEQYSLQLRQKPESKHFLIVLSPAIEDWLLENARLTGIDPRNFRTRQDLVEVTKNRIKVVKDQRFRQFLNDLKQANAPGFSTISAWINELREKHVW